MPLHHHLPQQLITESKLLMSTRLLEIENQILRKFQNCKNRQFVKRMFYREMDNLASLQQKISYLMVMLEDIDEERLDSYIYSSMLNDPYYDLEDTETDDTSVRRDAGNRMTQYKTRGVTNPSQNKYRGNTPSKARDNLFTQARTAAKKTTNNYYSQLPIDHSVTDQAIISSLQNSANSHLYKDLIHLHRSQKSQALLATADSMIHNQKILHQLKKLQMEKKLLKYQARRTPSYTQSPMQHLQSKTKQYVSDYQQQTDGDVNSSIDKDTTLKKSSNNYRTTAPKHSVTDIKQKKIHQKHSNSITNLFSFRPNGNMKKDRSKDNLRGQFGKVNNKKKVQFPSRFLEQEQQESQLERNFVRERQQHEIKNWQPYPGEKGLMSQEDSWLIERLNRKIREEDSLNSMLNHKKPFRVNSEKTLSQYESKLQRLQQERFQSGKQAQHQRNPFGSQLSDLQLKQKLQQFKNWLKSQPASSGNNYLNDKDYICYTQSERRKYGSNNRNNLMYDEYDGDSVRQYQGEGDGRIFKKKPQLIATQTFNKSNKSKGKNRRSHTKRKNKQFIKPSQSRSRSKGSPFNRLLSPSAKKLSSNHQKKTNNHSKNSKQKQKHHEIKEDSGQIQKRTTNRLLKRVRSSGCMIGQIPLSREKEDHRQLVNRYQVDGKRQQQVKQKIITTKEKLLETQ